MTVLVANNPTHLASVRAFAQQSGQLADLDAKLEYLDTYACRLHDQRVDRTLTRCVLTPDLAPYSFEFSMFRKDVNTGEYGYWFNGGCIYHGPHDGHGSGSAPTYATTITPTAGWSVHT